MTLAAPARLARIEVVLGRPRHHAANLHVLTRGGGGDWQRVRVVDARPPVEFQLERNGPPSHLLLLEPRVVEAVRLVQVGQRVRAWSVSELRLWEDAGGGVVRFAR
jgi:hypothetical protein